MGFSCLDALSNVNWPAGDAYGFFTTPQTSWENYDSFHNLNPAQCKLRAEYCYADARWERFKSIAAVAGGAAATLVMFAVAGMAAEIACELIVTLFLPLSSMAPLFVALSVILMTTSTLFIGYLTLTNISQAWGKVFLPGAANCWNHANHLCGLARTLEIRGAAN